MPLPHSRGFCKIKFFRGTALGCSITAICPASLAAKSVGEPIVAGESGGRSPFVNNNLQSQLKLNPQTADDRDRLSGDLYSGSELDRYSKEPEIARCLGGAIAVQSGSLSIGCYHEQKRA
jgi:hypothetical protein